MPLPKSLPRIYLVTPEPRPGRPLQDFVDALERSLQGGIRLVQLRAKTISDADYLVLARHAVDCCHRYGASIVLNAPLDIADALQADGLHLTSARLMHCAQRPLPVGKLLSCACHDAHQVRQAHRLGADLMTISPALPTATHTTARPLGWPGLQDLAALATAPVYALGGMTVDCLAQAQAAGAHGIAGIRSLWKGPVADGDRCG